MIRVSIMRLGAARGAVAGLGAVVRGRHRDPHLPAGAGVLPLTYWQQSWVTAAGAVLDGASLLASTVDRPRRRLRALHPRLRGAADRRLLRHPLRPRPAARAGDLDRPPRVRPGVPELASAGVPLKADLEQAWRDFAGWRVTYDGVLLALAALTMAPYCPGPRTGR